VGVADHRRRWATRVAVAFGIPVGLAGDGSAGSGRGGGRHVVDGASRRLRASRDRIGMWEREVAAFQLPHLCHDSSPVLYSAGDGGPPAIWAGHPRSGHVQEVQPDLWIGPWRSTPTFSPLISHCSYSCSVSEFGPSHCRSVYRACLAMIVITIRLTATITFPV
jgi:hypothetical protein